MNKQDQNLHSLCTVCGIELHQTNIGRARKTCSQSCKQKLYRERRQERVTKSPEQLVANIVTNPVAPLSTANKSNISTYDASSIKVLSEHDRMDNPAFDYELAERLARDFNEPIAWVKRGIAACRHAGVSTQYFVDRHLFKKPMPMNCDVDKAFRELFHQPPFLRGGRDGGIMTKVRCIRKKQTERITTGIQ
ncbi:hypothetical protein [Solemya elarraichensis gill symbiont]|uniref:Uncharacterized protein n=1 Tax=Solemya elarraichensis gill symbiont TaxID=1918949 RepID=A0A1T2L544_9GAMM|nr:hypothetical protein [Solemya elarraichensis gill symbiont]OOZ40235.1 hypothetical protein BOW52_06135 [Solemya elarraichensis gill symbiont]